MKKSLSDLLQIARKIQSPQYHGNPAYVGTWKMIDELCSGLELLASSDVAATRRTMRIAGYVVPVANVPPSMSDEAGRLLCQELPNTTGYDLTNGNHSHKLSSPFVAIYYDGADNRRHFSLRSPEGGADCGEIARQMAAHFNQLREGPLGPMSDPYVGSGTACAAEFDAPLGWEGEP